MGRKSIEITTLHGYKIEELIQLKNSLDSKYSRIVLTAITMKYCGHSNAEIATTTGKSNPTIISYIKKWNNKGIKSIKDHRGGSLGKLEPEIIDNLIHVALNNSPRDFDFVANTWTCELLALYIEKTYGVKVTGEAIRLTLKNNNVSYKRAQPMPTKADKKEQEAFKKSIRTTKYFRNLI